MSENKVINILGSRVSRDVFRANEDRGYKIGRYANRFDMFSACRPPVLTDRKKFDGCGCGDLMDSFAKTCLRLDLFKSVTEFIRQLPSDYLVIDPGSAASGRWMIGGTPFCAVPHRKRALMRMQNTGVIDKSLALRADKEEFVPEEMILDELRPFAEKIAEIYPPDRIILNEVQYAYFYDEDARNENSSLSAFDGLPAKKRINAYLTAVFNALKELLPGSHVIKMPQFIVSDRYHTGGLDPMNYTKEYYDYALRCIDAVTGSQSRAESDTELERLCNECSELYYNKYYYRTSVSLSEKNIFRGKIESLTLQNAFLSNILTKGTSVHEFMEKRGHRSAIIYGWNKVGEYFASDLLQNGFEVTCVVENMPRPKVCEELTEGGIAVLPRTSQTLPAADCILIADLYRQRQIIPYAAKKTSTRAYIDEDILNGGDDGAVKKYDVGVLGVWYGCNYGSVATYYALNRTLESTGRSVLMIDKPILMEHDSERENNHSRRFANEHYSISRQYYLNEFYKLNRQCDAFVIGSDQVWNYGISRNFGKTFYFDFADKDKKKIACAVSFGHGVDFAPQDEKTVISGFMKKIDGISVREKDGVRLCRDEYGINAVQLLDPVFIADPAIYESLIEKSKACETEPFIAAYILDPTPEKREALLRLSQKMGGMKIIVMLDGLPRLFEKNRELMGLPNCVPDLQTEDWLYYISKCEYLVTDSCHGASFGLIFQKNLAGIANRRRGFSRFESLFELFGISDHLITDAAGAYEDDSLLRPIDYGRVGEIMGSERGRCREWLREKLDSPKKSDEELARINANI